MSARSSKKFGAKTDALEVIHGHDLRGKEAIVTGASSGIGVETVRALAMAGARVVIATRDLPKAQAVAQQLSKETGSNKIEAEKLDLTSLKSVHEFSKNFLAKKRPLHILVNNAGVMACPLAYTEDGFEMQIGTNHFGHFALTMDLIPALKEGAKQSGKNARVVNVSSHGHAFSAINFDDIHWKNTPYNQFASYGQSKTANILFSVGLTKRFAKYGIYSNALMPGVIQTELLRHMTVDDYKHFKVIDDNGKIIDNGRFKTPAQGASTTIYACVAPELENRGGLYLNDCTICSPGDKKIIFEAMNSTGAPNIVAEYAVDENASDRLWEVSEKSTKAGNSNCFISKAHN